MAQVLPIDFPDTGEELEERLSRAAELGSDGDDEAWLMVKDAG